MRASLPLAFSLVAGVGAFIPTHSMGRTPSSLMAATIEGRKINEGGALKPINNYVLVKVNEIQDQTESGILLTGSVSILVSPSQLHWVLESISYLTCFLNEIFLYRLFDKIRNRSGFDYKKSYSQCGEDLIIRHVFDALRIPAPSYLDIGAHHPSFLNNTRIFYDHGARGVNVEPDPSLFAAFLERRPRDTNLNVGIAGQTGELPFYVMSTRTLNTFSEEEARTADRSGKVKIEKIVNIPVLNVNDVIRDHFPAPPDLVSLDVEGLDFAILQSLDLSASRPKVMCVETITFSEIRQGKKIKKITELMIDNNYFAYADTNVNTIFVDKNVW